MILNIYYLYNVVKTCNLHFQRHKGTNFYPHSKNFQPIFAYRLIAYSAVSVKIEL